MKRFIRVQSYLRKNGIKVRAHNRQIQTRRPLKRHKIEGYYPYHDLKNKVTYDFLITKGKVHLKGVRDYEYVGRTIEMNLEDVKKNTRPALKRWFGTDQIDIIDDREK